MKRLFGLVVVVACGGPRPPPETSKRVRHEIPSHDETFADPVAFFDVAGLRKVMVESRSADSLCDSRGTTMRLFRGREMVCEVGLDSHTACEGNQSWGHGEVALHSREPVQFDVRWTLTGDHVDLNLRGMSQGRCARYEVSPRGTCRQILVRTCEPDHSCKLDVKRSVREGFGRIRARFVDGTPLAGVPILIDGPRGAVVITDEDGRIEKSLAAGEHDLQLVSDDTYPIGILEHPITFRGNADEDVELEVDGTGCGCCGS